MPFSRSAGQAAERQKPISLFEGVHLAIKTEQRSDMNVWQQYHRPLWLSFPAERGMAISRFRPETGKAIDPVNPVNPVRCKNLQLSRPTNSYDDS